MKHKTVKITDNTLFVYKQNGQSAGKSNTTDTSITITMTTHTTGLYSSEKNRR